MSMQVLGNMHRANRSWLLPSFLSSNGDSFSLVIMANTAVTLMQGFVGDNAMAMSQLVCTALPGKFMVQT